jgi:hypothetical protein
LFWLHRKVWNQRKVFPRSENGKGHALIWSWVTPSSLKVWHSWTNAWRWRFGSSLPVKGECCTMRRVVTLILNDLPTSWRFMIGRSTMSGVHSSILRFGCGCSPMGDSWGWSSFGLGGGDSLKYFHGPSTLAFGSRVSNPLACVARLLCCKVFLDHPQKKVWVSWRGSQPSPVRVSNKTKI